MNNSVDPIWNRKIVQRGCKPQHYKRYQCLLRVAVYDVTWSALLRGDVIEPSRRHAYSVVDICLQKTHHNLFIHDKPIIQYIISFRTFWSTHVYNSFQLQNNLVCRKSTSIVFSRTPYLVPALIRSFVMIHVAIMCQVMSMSYEMKN